MLDLIEYLAQWVRAPLLFSASRATSCSSAARAGAAGGGAPPRSCSTRCTTDADAQAASRALLPGSAARPRTSPSDRRARRRQPVLRRGDGAPARDEAGAATRASCRTPSRRCSRPGSTRSSRFERRLVQHAAVVGRTFWEGALAAVAADEGRDLREALDALQEKDIIVPDASDAARRRARVRVQARADPRRRLRDAAEGGALPQALRGRPVHRGPGGRAHRRGRGAARRALRPRRDAGRRGAAATVAELEPIDEGAALPRGGRRRRRLALLQPRGRSTTTSRSASLSTRARTRTARA